MADINQVITLGIGTPSDIAHFTLFGLSPTGIQTITVGSYDYLVRLPADDYVVRLPKDDLVIRLPPDPEVDLP